MTTTVVFTVGFGVTVGVAGFVVAGVLGDVVGLGVELGVKVSVGVGLGCVVCEGAGLDVLGAFVAEGVGLGLEEHPARRIELKATTVIAMKGTRFTVDTSFSCLGLNGVIGGTNTGETRRYRFVAEHNTLG